MGLSRLQPAPGPRQAPGCAAQRSPQCSAQHDKKTQTRTKNLKERCRWNDIVYIYLYFNEVVPSLLVFFLIFCWYEWVNGCVGGKSTLGRLLKLSCKLIRVAVFGVENKIIQKYSRWVCPNQPLCYSSGGKLGRLWNGENTGNKR